MRKILEEYDCFDIQLLRKVSRDIRSCIDSSKPNPRVERCYIIQKRHREKWDRDIDGCSSTHEYSDTFDFFIRSRNGQMKWIRYRNKELIQNKDDWHVHKFVYCGDTVTERVVNDFKINIENQKSTMDELKLECDGKLFELIGNVLKSRDTRLSVKELKMKVTDEKDIMNILPYLDSVLKLDQWKNALDVFVCGCINFHELDLLNFRRINITIDSLSTNDIMYFKESIEKSVKFDKFIISFKKNLPITVSLI
uniref:FTH domain-containing protein n=1 Tax=Caenorhabditis tropicalis TaxID=1561998 RepID=A0A1I7UDY5_9PELO